MSDYDREPALTRFIAELNRIWKAAGPPSFAEVEALSRKFTQPVQSSGLRVRELTRSTTQGILAGRRRGLPKWPWVASFVIVLRAVAAKNGIAADSLGTLEEWKARHAAADASLRRVKKADHAGDDADDEAAGDRLAALSTTINRRQAGAGAVATSADVSLLTHADSERDRRASVLALLRHARTLGWWHQYRDVVPDWFEVYLSVEPAAAVIRTYETQLIPDLLQTEEYADAAIRLERDATPAAEVRRRVELRMLRQRILHRPDPAKVWVILDERALRRRIGGPAMMRAQIDHLIEVSQWTSVAIQMMPGKEGHALAGGCITVLRFRDQELPDVAYLRQGSGALYPFEPSAVDRFCQVLDRLAIEAESPTATTDFLHRLRTDL